MSTIISLILTYVSPATPFGSWNLVSWVLGLAWMTPLKTLQLDEWTIAWCGKIFVSARPSAVCTWNVCQLAYVNRGIVTLSKGNKLAQN